MLWQRGAYVAGQERLVCSVVCVCGRSGPSKDTLEVAFPFLTLRWSLMFWLPVSAEHSTVSSEVISGLVASFTLPKAVLGCFFRPQRISRNYRLLQGCRLRGDALLRVTKRNTNTTCGAKNMHYSNCQFYKLSILFQSSEIVRRVSRPSKILQMEKSACSLQNVQQCPKNSR